MGKDYRVILRENRNRPPLFEGDFEIDIIRWSENSPVSHQELEVYVRKMGEYIGLEQFVKQFVRPPDSVNHPSHYTAYKGFEVIDLTEQMNFNRGNAVKYIARAGLKDKSKEVEDLEKAAWYIKREIERLSKTN